jgi:hypothetical protein
VEHQQLHSNYDSSQPRIAGSRESLPCGDSFCCLAREAVTSRVTHCQEPILPDRENRVRVLAGDTSPSANQQPVSLPCNRKRGDWRFRLRAFISLSALFHPILTLDSYTPLLVLTAIDRYTMAIHPQLRSRESQGTLSPQQAVAISAGTEQASASLENLTLSESRPEANASTPSRSGLRGATVSISIPLDDEPPATPSRVQIAETRPPTVSFRRREPLRRDSLKRREALLKGKDGSRRRQRWENGMARRVLGTPSRGRADC